MVLFDHVVEILTLTDGDGGAMLLVVALDRRFVGPTPVDRDLLRYAMATDRLGQKAFRGLLVALLREEKVNCLACFIHGAIEIAPFALHLNVGLVHAPTAPYRALTPVKRL